MISRKIARLKTKEILAKWSKEKQDTFREKLKTLDFSEAKSIDGEAISPEKIQKLIDMSLYGEYHIHNEGEQENYWVFSLDIILPETGEIDILAGAPPILIHKKTGLLYRRNCNNNLELISG